MSQKRSLFLIVRSNLFVCIYSLEPPWIKMMGVKFFRGLGLTKVMMSYLTVSEFFYSNT